MHHARNAVYLERVQRQAIKYLFNDCTSEFKPRIHSIIDVYYFNKCDMIFLLKTLSIHLKILTSKIS